MSNKFENAAAAEAFMMAGKSTVTLKSAASGVHFTFKIDKAKDADLFFAKVLTGSDNSWNGDWMFIGTIRPMSHTGGFQLNAGKKGRQSAISFKALQFTLNCLRAEQIPNMLEIWHEGQCGMCRKPLTDPTSIELGLGPVCRAKL